MKCSPTPFHTASIVAEQCRLRNINKIKKIKKKNPEDYRRVIFVVVDHVVAGPTGCRGYEINAGDLSGPAYGWESILRKLAADYR